MPTYLAKRGATYYFRRVIPDGLRPAFGGKTEIMKSLRTKDRVEASRLCRLEAVKSDGLFDLAGKASATLDAAPPEAASYDSADVQEYAAVVAYAFRQEREKAAQAGGIEAFLDGLRHTLGQHEWNLKTGGLVDRFPLAMSESMVIGIKAVLTGEGAANLPPVKLGRDAEKADKNAAVRLPGLIDGWALERQPKPKTVDMWKRSCALFEGVVGEKPVGKVTKADVIAFKDHLVVAGRSPATVANRLNQLRSLFRYAMDRDIIGSDPSASVKAPPAKRAKLARFHYDASALSALFGGPVHSLKQRPNRGGGEAAYWLPLLALYTGARLNEIGQLRPKDIVQEAYRDADDREQAAWTIRIVEDEADGLTLKFPSCARRVPLHQAMIDLGFLNYVEDAKTKGHGRIFPDLKPDRYGTVTGNWSKWFSYYLRTVCGVSDKQIVFHSLRHSFKHYGRESGFPKNVNDEFTGHETGDVADTYGGLEYPLRPLVEWMALYRVPGFRLPLPPGS